MKGRRTLHCYSSHDPARDQKIKRNVSDFAKAMTEIILPKSENHSHEEEDELFFVQKGTLEMHFRDRIEIVNEGEIIVVPKGVEHCPKTRNGEEVHVLLFEKKQTQHTGNVVHEKTKSHYPKI